MSRDSVHPEVSVAIQTALGKLKCGANNDPKCPRLMVYWGERQIAVIEAASPVVRIMVWDTDAAEPSGVVPVFPGYGEVG
jgi:hypothetical protein